MTKNPPFSPKVIIVTLNWNGKEDTLECLASLNKINYPNFEIVVSDNGSIDGSIDAIRTQFQEVHLIQNGTNLGYAKGFNSGLEYAFMNGADYVLIINNDTRVDSNVLNALVQIAESDKNIGFVSGKVYFYDDPNKIQTVGRHNHPFFLTDKLVGYGEDDLGQYDQVKEYDFLDDVFLLVSKKAYEATGGYNPNFFLYYEETDWCARIRKAGFKIVYTPHAKIWHKLGRSTGGDKGPIYTYYITRNQILFIRRNSATKYFLRYLVYLAIISPRRVARWLKYKRFTLISAYFRGLGSGFVWLIKGK